MKNSKRAFTIVELVIVIAVIAILAAVLIPTFSGLIEKANVNSDQAAVKQMNTYLAADEQINGPAKTYDEALKVLNKSNLDANHYVALAAGYSLIYVPKINRVLYIDENSTVVYPEEYVNNPIVSEEKANGYWYTLSGSLVPDSSWRALEYTNLENLYSDTTVEKVESYFKGSNTSEMDKVNKYATAFRNDTSKSNGIGSYVTSDGTVYTFNKIRSGMELLDFNAKANKMDANTSYEETEKTTLFLSQDIDLASSDWKPIDTFAGSIDGYTESNESKQITISNLNMSSPHSQVRSFINGAGDSLNYYYGFIMNFKGSYLGNLTFENVNVNKPGYETINGTKYQTVKRGGQYASVVCGLISPVAGKDMLIENIVVKSGEVVSAQRAAGLFGAIGENSVSETKTPGSWNGTPFYELADNWDNYGNYKGSVITIKNCKNYANVTSLSDYDQTKTSCGYSTAAGIVCKVGSYAGGFTVKFEDVENYGNITALNAAGFIATINGPKITLEFNKCTSAGNITSIVRNSSNEKDTTNTSPEANASGFISSDSFMLAKVKFNACTIKNITISCVEENTTFKASGNYKYSVSTFGEFDWADKSFIQVKPELGTGEDGNCTVENVTYKFNIKHTLKEINLRVFDSTTNSIKHLTNAEEIKAYATLTGDAFN